MRISENSNCFKLFPHLRHSWLALHTISDLEVGGNGCNLFWLWKKPASQREWLCCNWESSLWGTQVKGYAAVPPFDDTRTKLQIMFRLGISLHFSVHWNVLSSENLVACTNSSTAKWENRKWGDGVKDSSPLFGLSGWIRGHHMLMSARVSGSTYSVVVVVVEAITMIVEPWWWLWKPFTTKWLATGRNICGLNMAPEWSWIQKAICCNPAPATNPVQRVCMQVHYHLADLDYHNNNDVFARCSLRRGPS